MRGTLAPVNQAGAGGVVVVGELLPVGDGGGGELVALHLLLLNSQVLAQRQLLRRDQNVVVPVSWWF